MSVIYLNKFMTSQKLTELFLKLKPLDEFILPPFIIWETWHI